MSRLSKQPKCVDVAHASRLCLIGLADVKKRTIMFSDVQSSSKHWQRDPVAMNNALSEHFARIDRLAKQNGALIVKTIGDAFMFAFDGDDRLARAIDMAREMQRDLLLRPIVVGSDRFQLRLRIGIADGPVFAKTHTIQNCTVEDYVGPSVNVASRMESKVSPVGGFAVGVAENSLHSPHFRNILKMVEERCDSDGFDVSVQIYNDGCDTDYIAQSSVVESKRSQSARLLSVECFESSVLHGVGDVLAILCVPQAK